MCICGNVIDHLHLYSHNVYYVKSRRRQPRKIKRKIDLSFLIGNMLQTA